MAGRRCSTGMLLIDGAIARTRVWPYALTASPPLSRAREEPRRHRFWSGEVARRKDTKKQGGRRASPLLQFAS